MEESIKENEPVAEAEQAAAAPPPASLKKHKVTSLIREMWPAYLIEILVIILGISITLALEEWRDNAKEKHLEQVYLKNLRTDLGLDRQTLKYSSSATQKLLDRGNELLAYVGNPAGKALAFDQVIKDVQHILERPKFISNDATFSDLKSSGNLHLLEDIRLKNLLFAYYSQTLNIKENQDAEQQATITISGAFFLKLFPMDNARAGDQQHDPAPDTHADLSKNIEFRNNVLLRVANRKELLYLYQKADSLAIQLDQILLTKTGE
jgi:hypothetical protein